MGYKLTLTYQERRAIDWIGHRYSNGYDLYRLLWVETPEDCQSAELTSEQIEQEGLQWDTDVDITFDVPEHVAWQIRENAMAEDGLSWPCFSPDLSDKMQQFIDSIV